MKKKLSFYVVGVLIVMLALLAVSCGGTTPAPAEELKVETPKIEETKAVEPPITVGPTPIPHTLEGRDNCLLCHETGVGDATAIPADHAGRTNNTCTTCHRPAP